MKDFLILVAKMLIFWKGFIDGKIKLAKLKVDIHKVLTGNLKVI